MYIKGSINLIMAAKKDYRAYRVQLCTKRLHCGKCPVKFTLKLIDTLFSVYYTMFGS